MGRVRWLDRKASKRGEYAGKKEFASVFDSERAGLQRLALLLTADSETAKLCLFRAFRECITSSSVAKEWAFNWTRRMVIRNAIGLVMCPGGQSFVNTNDEAGKGFLALSPDDSLGAIATPESILDLPKFERFVFIICVLERYSILDCALLLGKSPRDVTEARHRVGNQAGQIDEMTDASHCLAIR